MKISDCLFLSVLLLSFAAEAKYVYPEGATTTTERKVNRRINNYDADKDGDLSLEEYKNFCAVRTRDDRRMERRARKNGSYLSPEETFKAMDKDGDGVVSSSEMLEYEKEKAR